MRALLALVAAVALAVVVALVLDDDPSRCAIPPDQDRSAMRDPGCPALGDRAAAERVERSAESRPGNREANRRRPTRPELRRFRERNDYVPRAYAARVTGDFTGTTDDILEWAAWKWGVEEDLLRAQALHESDWRMSARGDGGVSIGVMQIKRTVHRGTFPLSARSTAFNLDYYGAVFRYYYDGRATWLDEVERGQPYEPGDPWGSIGAHYAGRWYAAGAVSYIEDVRRILRERRWPGA